MPPLLLGLAISCQPSCNLLRTKIYLSWSYYSFSTSSFVHLTSSSIAYLSWLPTRVPLPCFLLVSQPSCWSSTYPSCCRFYVSTPLSSRGCSSPILSSNFLTDQQCTIFNPLSARKLSRPKWLGGLSYCSITWHSLHFYQRLANVQLKVASPYMGL